MEPSPAAIGIDTGTAIALIAVVTLPIAAIAFARSGPAWRSIGKGPLAIEQNLPPRHSGNEAPVDKGLQAAEARQMIEAKSYRRQRRGEPPLDVEAEVRQLLDSSPAAPSADAELRDEVRRLVIARNERRLRQGQPPLDVEAETERQLEDFVGSG
jgi:hypothetical protein